ncbi:MAG: hypothetical protein WCG34_01600 [Leptolinea sp.]
MKTISEDLRHTLRQWTTGGLRLLAENIHEMFVFLDPPIVSVMLVKNALTFNHVQESGKFPV